ncbi:serine/threonine protein kinase [Nostoc sp. NIES-4103]|nr:serine/threonine protein kinase [Nostoc sp. NIES-4103]
MLGQTVGGRYQILTQLGQGGFGTTFLQDVWKVVKYTRNPASIPLTPVAHGVSPMSNWLSERSIGFKLFPLSASERGSGG